MNHNKQARRVFIKKALATGLSVTGIAAFTVACSNNNSQEQSNEVETAPETTANNAPVDDCNDFSGVSQAEMDKRKALGYEDVTPFTDKQCDNCQLFIPAKEGKKCGGCMLFKGPVFDNAHCTYWAPQTDA